jgi:hypothetical protein
MSAAVAQPMPLVALKPGEGGKPPALQIAPERTWLPLVFLQVAAGLNEDEALTLIEDGSVHPAINIGQSDVRREIRVARAALLAYQPGQPRAKLRLETVIAESFPPYLSLARSATIRGVDLRARLSCSEYCIARMIKDGELIQADETKAGRASSPLIFFASVIQCLKRRVI